MPPYVHGKSIIRIAVADDHTSFRECLASKIDSWENCKVIIEAANGVELIQQIQQKPETDLVILDINMPVMDGFETAKRLKENYPEIKILGLSVFSTELAITRIIQTGANGFLCKSASVSEIKSAIFEVMKKGVYFGNDETGVLTKRAITEKKFQQKYFLNETEIRFLKFICTDMTYKAIALKLRLNERQTDYMREQMFNKFDARSRTELAKYIMSSGFFYPASEKAIN